MAERRMFAKSIIESDPFMDMPPEAQMLYIRLNMAADDDGFCDNPRSIMRSCGASNDSMKLLIAKKFVLTFEKKDNFIVVIKHWRMNNYIRKDTYHETKYKEFMRELYYDENQSYSLNPGDGHVPCIPGSRPAPVTLPSQTRDEPVTDPSRDRDDPLTQVRLGKDSIDKSSTVKVSTGKGECERENPETPDPDTRIEKIKSWKHRVDIFKNQGFDASPMYNLAFSTDGITKEEIDSYKEDIPNE